MRAWRAKRFWAPTAKTSAVIVLGRFDKPEWEPSGLLGVGDVQALTSLNQHLRDLYIETPAIKYDDELRGADLGRSTLIILGGPDANKVNGELAEALSTGYRLVHDDRKGIIVVDDLSDAQFAPSYDKEGNVVIDYGIVVRAPNPFGAREKGRYAYSFAGCFGFGTQTAVDCATDHRFLNAELVVAGAPIECLVRATVADSTPRRREIVSIRRLPA
jgi:hypothetical protein